MNSFNLEGLDDYSALMPFIDDWEAGQAEFLGELLYDTLKPTCVCDWGCASGLYLLPFKRHGCQVLGIDAEPTAGKKLERSEFYRADLRRVVWMWKCFDLSLCIEVGEHLPEPYADHLVKSIALSSRHVFWSAAHVGQGGLYHYNEQPKEYWLEKFARHHFVTHPQNDFVQARIAANEDCQRVQWLLNNSVLLTKDESRSV